MYRGNYIMSCTLIKKVLHIINVTFNSIRFFFELNVVRLNTLSIFLFSTTNCIVITWRHCIVITWLHMLTNDLTLTAICPIILSCHFSFSCQLESMNKERSHQSPLKIVDILPFTLPPVWMPEHNLLH